MGENTGSVLRTVLAGGGLAVILAITGCATTPQTDTARGLPDAPQTEPAAVEPVSREVYERAFDAFASCMDDAGAPLLNPRLENAVWRYSVPESGLAILETCYPPFQPVDADWQIANEYDSTTQQALRACLEGAGIPPADTVEAVWQQIQESGIDPVECTTVR